MIRDLLEKKGTTVLVIGLGVRTGLASANFLAERGVAVTVSDSKDHHALADITAQLHPEVNTILGNQGPEVLDKGFDLIVLSPGVPFAIPLVQQAVKLSIPVIAEVELAYLYMKGSWIAITGTDGKSTTTALTNHILKTIGFDSREGGNIGIPLISLVDSSNEKTVTVAELSSFQLETVETFCPETAALLNLAPDHLDRYDSMDDYLRAKLRIAQNMGQEHTLVYNLDDEVISMKAKTLPGIKKSFSVCRSDADAWYENEELYLNIDGQSVKAAGRSDFKLPGIHNVKNALAALLMVQDICQKRNVPFELKTIVKAIASFKGLEHRLEPCGEINGTTFINDSKATTVNAAMTAVNSVGSNTVIIVGGRTKGEDYSSLARQLKGKIKAVVLIGESRETFTQYFKGFELRQAESMMDAVEKAFKVAGAGGVVLLSPACASFDMYKNYEIRGKDFKQCVQALIRRSNGS